MCYPRLIHEAAELAPSSVRGEDGLAAASRPRETIHRRLIKTIKHNHQWASENGARIMRDRAMLTKFLGPLCLPMLVVLPQITDQYNLRATSVLALVLVLICVQYGGSKIKRSYTKHRRSWQRGLERHCEKCDQQLAAQLKRGVRPAAVAWTVRSLRRFPWRLMSRHWGRIAETELPRGVAAVVVWFYARLFNCKLEEAENADVNAYNSINAFFTRRLKAGARVVDAISPVVSPSDGTVTYRGRFTGGFLQQVKGVHYSANYFLGLDATGGEECRLHAACSDVGGSSLCHRRDGSTALFQWVVYLSPGDYHRFHSPAKWSVLKRRHFPGELLSVKPSMVGALPGLFHLNERVAWLGEWEHGFFSMTAVGATNVGSIHCAFEPGLATNRATSARSECTVAAACSGRNFVYSEKSFHGSPVALEAGQDFGHFSFGSTLVLIFEAPKDLAFVGEAADGRVLMGQSVMAQL